MEKADETDRKIPSSMPTPFGEECLRFLVREIRDMSPRVLIPLYRRAFVKCDSNLWPVVLANAFMLTTSAGVRGALDMTAITVFRD